MKPCMVCHIFRAEIFCTRRVVAQWPSLQRKQALALREMARLILDAHKSSKTSMSLFLFCLPLFSRRVPRQSRGKTPLCPCVDFTHLVTAICNNARWLPPFDTRWAMIWAKTRHWERSAHLQRCTPRLWRGWKGPLGATGVAMARAPKTHRGTPSALVSVVHSSFIGRVTGDSSLMENGEVLRNWELGRSAADHS